VTSDLAGGGWDRSDSAEVGEGSLAPKALGVVPGGDQQRGGRVSANALDGDQLRRGFAHQPIELLTELRDLLGEPEIAAIDWSLCPGSVLSVVRRTGTSAITRSVFCTG
jgi:hypothetical protein